MGQGIATWVVVGETATAAAAAAAAAAGCSGSER